MSDKRELVEPRTLKGFQDLLPESIIARNRVVGAITAVFERYGFVPVETPAVEHIETLLGTGGEDTNKELFRFETPEQDGVALRFDHTVPFARLLAQYPEQLKTPFRRYAVGPVWRADRPGPGRFRQFTQLDVDIAGANDVAADAELIAIMVEAMAAAGAGRAVVLINNRKLIDALLEGHGIEDAATQKHVLRVIDKLAKVGEANIRLELADGRIDDSGDPIPGVHLDAQTIDGIMAFIAVRGDTRADVVTNLAKALPPSDVAEAALAEMRTLAECLDALGVSEERAQFLPSLARGLDYYTGPVFEIVLPDAPEFGSVGGGGRYDQLVERFLNQAIPCTGFSVGLDRLMAALQHLGAVPQVKTTTQVLVVTVGKVPRHETLRLASELRAAGLRTETYFASKKKMGMKFQLAHADQYGIPVAVILGEDELANGVVAIKDLEAGKREREHIDDHEAYREAGRTGQATVRREELIETIRMMLQG